MQRIIIIQKLFPMRQAIKTALALQPPQIAVDLPKDEGEAERLIIECAARGEQLLVVTGYQRWNVRYGEEVVRAVRFRAPEATLLICSGQPGSTFAHLRDMIDGTITRDAIVLDQLVRLWEAIPDIRQFADKVPGLKLYDRSTSTTPNYSDEDPDIQTAPASA